VYKRRCLVIIPDSGSGLFIKRDIIARLTCVVANAIDGGEIFIDLFTDSPVDLLVPLADIVNPAGQNLAWFGIGKLWFGLH
jgi:hypothetical protein